MSRVPVLAEEALLKKIFLIRGQEVMFDFDLAQMYGVETRILKQAVKRNIGRFPKDFMFTLNAHEYKNLRSQFVISSWGGTRYTPMVFTEQGVAMLSSVLNSARAVAINIQIMRIFVVMRRTFVTSKDIMNKIEKLETSELEQNKQIQNLYNLIRNWLQPAFKKTRPIGFRIKAQQRTK